MSGRRRQLPGRRRRADTPPRTANPAAGTPPRRRYYPARTCHATRTLCNAKNVQSWATKEACCGPSGAFGQQGCSTYVPVTPCYTIDTYYPQRKCIRSDDVAVCNRG